MPTSTRRTLAAWAAAGVLGTAVVAGAVVSAAGAASAAGAPSTTLSTTASTTPTVPHRPWAALRHAGIHGEFTVQNKSGDFVVLDTQRGTVTANQGGQLTVKSADGFTTTYTVDSTTKIRKDGAKATLAGLKVGDTVGVVGVKSGDTVTAKGIRDGVPERRETPSSGATSGTA